MIYDCSRQGLFKTAGFILLIVYLLISFNAPTVHAENELIQYAYDNSGQILKVAYNNETVVEYVYDNMGNRIYKTTALSGEPANNPPNPVSTTLSDGLTGVSVTPVLNWIGGGDPDGDPVAYYLYLGESTEPPLVSSGVETTYAPGQLKSYTTYYWQVLSRDNHNADTAGPLWSFTTGGAPPVASFYADKIIGIAPVNIQFIDTSIGTDAAVVSWQWDFNNDGVTDSTLRNPNFTFNSVGNYTVSLKVTDAGGLSSKEIKVNYISVQEDLDRDLIPDGIDNCLKVYNPDQANMDHTSGDPLGDACDPDIDGDGYDNDIDVCPLLNNPDQADTDGDGYGDSCTNVQCVSDSAGFRTALDTAKTNEMDDVIRLVQGTYSGSTFSYRSNHSHSLVIQGGYSSGCNTRTPDPANTIIDGEGVREILKIEDTSEMYNLRQVVIDGVTIQNGRNGLHITSPKGNIAIRGSIIKNNGYNLYHSGIYASSSTGIITLEGSIIENNNTGSDTVYLNTTYGKLNISNNIIRSNVALGRASGIALGSNFNEISISGNVIENNSANYYAGLYVTTTTGAIVLSNNIITDNTANMHGAGIYVFAIDKGSTIKLVNNTIYGNKVVSTNQAGGLYLILNNVLSRADIYNNIIWGNTARTGGDIYIENAVRGTINAYNNDFDPAKVYGSFTSAGNNINTVPQFKNAAARDYHLTGSSDCVDTGDNAAPLLPATDYEENPRILDGNSDAHAIVDIGAYEFIIDSDNDGTPDDGDGSGISGDNPCTGGNIEGCDDNCAGHYNSDQADMDSDGVGDPCDNCSEVANAEQGDANAGEDDNTSLDGQQHYGDLCDPDFNNDGLVSLGDFNEWRLYFRQSVPPAPDYLDIKRDGQIGLGDFNIWRSYYRSAPGPGVGD